MWFMLNRMDFGNVLHMTQVRMAKALKVPPSQISRALKKLETLQLVACADQGTYVISAKPGEVGVDNATFLAPALVHAVPWSALTPSRAPVVKL